MSTKMVNGVSVPLTQAEIDARAAEETAWTNGEFDRRLESFRKERNEKLVETDYLALSDQTLSAAMTTYRQDLRDATNGMTTVADIDNYTWPTKP